MNKRICQGFRRLAAIGLSMILACLPLVGQGQGLPAGLYMGLGLGGNGSPAVTVASRSDDRASVCDEYINPRALAVPGCTAPDRGAGDGWRAPFDAGRGFSAEAELGAQWSARFRAAVIYAYRSTAFDQTVSSTDATGADFDKISDELAVGEETLGTVASHELFVAGFRNWPNRSRWTPYAGAGVGISSTRMDFSYLWARSANPTEIASGADQPNAAEIRRNLAGTVSAGRAVLRDVLAGYVLVAGVERAVSEVVTVGVRAQWKGFEAFESEGYRGTVLRSHPPNLRRDGSEPVHAWSRTRDTGRAAVFLTLRYSMQ